MKHLKWQFWFGAALLALSGLIYLLHYSLFHDTHHIFIFLVADIAFVPIEVLLVTLIIHQLLTRREKKATLSKLNMVIGTFFSEIGTELMGRLAKFDTQSDEICQRFRVNDKWSDRDFSRLRQYLSQQGREINSRAGQLEPLRELLVQERTFLVTLLENGNLLEHETFTDLLWAVFHLAEEFDARSRLTNLPPADMEHISGDMRRAYRLLLIEWLAYMQHLKKSYPYLFSLAIRTNPLREDRCAIIGELAEKPIVTSGKPLELDPPEQQTQHTKTKNTP